jgi:hypothetical protein
MYSVLKPKIQVDKVIKTKPVGKSDKCNQKGKSKGKR